MFRDEFMPAGEPELRGEEGLLALVSRFEIRGDEFMLLRMLSGCSETEDFFNADFKIGLAGCGGGTGIG